MTQTIFADLAGETKTRHAAVRAACDRDASPSADVDPFDFSGDHTDTGGAR